MSFDSPPAPGRKPAVSKRHKKEQTRWARFVEKTHLRVNRRIKGVLRPLYRKLGIKSILRIVYPSYRQVTRSPGGVNFEGKYLGQVGDFPLIAAIGDYGSGKRESHAVADMVLQEGANAVVTLGDNVYFETGFQTLVGNLYGDYLEAGAFFPATGNHDYTEGRGIAVYDRYFDFLDGNRWYSVVFGDVEFFLLDSHQALHHPESFEEQKQWLEKATASSTARWKIVVVHHPPHSARSRSQHEFRFPFDEWGVCMVMSGHDHTLQHLTFDGVHYVVNGIGGGSLHEFDEILEGTEYRLSGEFGGVLLECRPDILRVRFVTVNQGEVYTFDIPAGH
jgi:tartrate-resistant acid phosphatase type 5